jgi:hypothetical protein
LTAKSLTASESIQIRTAAIKQRANQNRLVNVAHFDVATEKLKKSVERHSREVSWGTLPRDNNRVRHALGGHAFPAIDIIDRCPVCRFALTFPERSSCFGSKLAPTFTKRWLMNTYIPLILTTIVTISTIIYTICSIQLWRTTQAAAEISRQAALGNLWAELNRYLEILRQQDAPETAFLQKVSDLMVEFMIAKLLTHAIEKNDQDFEEIRRKVLALMSENEAHASKIPWVARLVEQRRRH